MNQDVLHVMAAQAATAITNYARYRPNDILLTLVPGQVWSARINRRPWVYIDYTTPAGIGGRLYWIGADDHWRAISTGKDVCFLMYQFSALLPVGTRCALVDKGRGWLTGSVTVGISIKIDWN